MEISGTLWSGGSGETRVIEAHGVIIEINEDFEEETTEIVIRPEHHECLVSDEKGPYDTHTLKFQEAPSEGE